METKVTHTPGPWNVSPPLGEGDYAVLSNKVTAYGNFYVAVIPNGAHAEAEANAHLIAAAPELLNALELAMHMLGKIHTEAPMSIDPVVLESGRAALIKARGEAA